MHHAIARISAELETKKDLLDRFELFSRNFGGARIELKKDSYYPFREFKGSNGIAVYLAEGQCDGETPFPPNVTGTHKVPHQRNLNYTVSSLKPGDFFTELAALSARDERERKDAAMLGQVAQSMAEFGIQVLVTRSREPEPRSISPADFDARQLVVIRNDVIIQPHVYVRRPELARDTFFCAMYQDALK